MRVRLLLISIVALSLAILVAAAIPVYIAREKLDQVTRELKQAQWTARQMSELQALTQEYLLNPNETSSGRWRQLQFEFSGALESYRPITQVGQAKLNEIRGRNTSLKRQFATLDLKPSDLGDALSQRSATLQAGELNAELQAMGDSTYRWALAADAERAERENTLFLARASLLMVLLSALAAVTWITIVRVLRPLSALVDAARAVAAGDYRHKVDDAGRKDEFGAVSSAFNAMTSALEEKSGELTATNQRLRQEAAQSQRARQDFEALFEWSPGAILVVDQQHRIAKANGAAHSLFGYPAQALAGLPADCILPGLAGCTLPGDGALPAGEAVPSPARAGQSALRYDGSGFVAHLTLGALDVNGSSCTVVIVQDVTEQEQLQHSLRAAKELAESASKAKSEFVANMSHEIRTPMNAVLGMTYLLGNSSLSGEQRKYLDMIRASGQSLLAILNDILDFSKIEAGRMELVTSPFQLDDVLKTLASIMMANASAKDLELAIGVEPNVPHHLIGDALRLQQVLINLTGNSIKFTESGEVSIYVETAARHGDEVVLNFHVRDTGMGMDVEQQARLFSAFTQVDESSTRRFGGTGLGLTISKRLTELMGGSISVRSQLGKGTEFCVRLSMQVAQDDAEQSVPPLLQNSRILIVDDSATSRDFLNKIFQTWHWHADSAESLAQALQQIAQLRQQGRSYDAVLLDWQMQEAGGAPALQQIRAAFPQLSAPFILLTNAYGHRTLLKDAVANEADAVLVKPITGSSLFDSLHEVLTRRKDGVQGRTAVDIGADNLRLRGRRLLLVEDNAFNQQVAKGMLEHNGAQVDVTEDGQQAVQLLRTRAQDYDLVLMDVQMPVMDGFTATNLIRTELRLDLPILAMTAGVTEGERDRCLRSGMNGFIAKPIDVDLMLATIVGYLPQQNNQARPDGRSAAAAAPADTSPHFDPRWFNALTRGNAKHRETVVGYLRMLIERGNAPLDEVRAVWEAQKLDETSHLLHRLRGSIGTLGARRFAELTLEMEKHIHEGDTAAAQAVLPALELALQTTIREAKLWLEALDAAAADQT